MIASGATTDFASEAPSHSWLSDVLMNLSFILSTHLLQEGLFDFPNDDSVSMEAQDLMRRLICSMEVSVEVVPTIWPVKCVICLVQISPLIRVRSLYTCSYIHDLARFLMRCGPILGSR